MKLVFAAAAAAAGTNTAATVLLGFIVLGLVVVAASAIVHELRSGILCDCPGDCPSCKIKCQTNEKYYGVHSGARRQLPPQLIRKRQKQSKTSQVFQKIRAVIDRVSYWLFNLCAIACVLMAIIHSVQKLF